MQVGKARGKGHLDSCVEAIILDGYVLSSMAARVPHVLVSACTMRKPIQLIGSLEHL